MQKQMFNKKIILCICAAAAVFVLAAVLLVSGKEEAYRSIMVYEVEGEAVIERADIGSMNAAENLYLESGDCVRVAAAALMRMKLDSDKYVTAEENTVFTLEAEGNDRDSKTRICLEQGAITSEIQSPLSTRSQYETATPNSVMAVRGTIYRVELVPDDDGKENTKVCCFEGTVGASPILPDGTLGEEVPVPAGSELTVYSDGTMGEPAAIDFAGLSAQGLAVLDSLLANGASVTGITQEELAELMEESRAQAAQREADGAKQADQPDVTAETQTDNDLSGAEEEAGEQDSAKQQASDTETDNGGEKKGSGKGQTGSSRKPQEETQDTPKPQDTAQAADKPSTAPAGKTADTGNDSGAASDQGSDQSSGSDSSSENGEQNKDEDKDKDKDKDDNKEDNKPSKKVWQVTFEYQGTVFATQTVVNGEKAAAPMLAPAQSGGWDFDFNTKIKANTTVQWK